MLKEVYSMLLLIEAQFIEPLTSFKLNVEY